MPNVWICPGRSGGPCDLRWQPKFSLTNYYEVAANITCSLPSYHSSTFPAIQQIMFQHTPLDLQQPSIRLVEVLPPDPSGYVYCNVKHANINDEYICVSYVWGPPEDVHCIYLNGQPFRVRRNLLEFLETVSSQSINPKPKSPRLDFRQAATSLWIDALCIDQENNGERNHQVQQMGKIFEHAQRVIAWIGKKTAYASLFRYMRDELRNQRFFDANHFIALDGLCKDVYWQRAWVRTAVSITHVRYVLNL
jgi:hypothetical protein